MLAYIIIVGLILGAGYWTLRPLLQGEGCQEDYAPAQEDILRQLDFKKEETYATIRDLEFDLKMGKLSDEDFQILKQQYREEAVGYLKEIDQLKSLEPIRTESSDQDRDDKNEGEIKSTRPREKTKKYIYCTDCGEKAPWGVRFCAGCGSPLNGARINSGSEGKSSGKAATKC